MSERGEFQYRVLGARTAGRLSTEATLPIETIGADDPRVKVPKFLAEVRKPLAAGVQLPRMYFGGYLPITPLVIDKQQ